MPAMATAAAVARRRINRKLRNQGKTRPPQRHAGRHVERQATALTAVERRTLLRKAKAMIDAGEVDLAVMGVRFLELRFLGWSAEHFAGDRRARGVADVQRWAGERFREAEAWWSDLHHATRAELIRMTRACSAVENSIAGR